jgi:hypothetical protein
MKNLEKQIIKRLNKVLNKYNLAIISKNNHNYKTTISVDNMFKNGCSEYVLVEIKDNTIIDYYFMWNNIKNIVLESFLNYSLFDAINDSHTFIKYCDINPNIKTDRINILIAKLYNEIMVLNHCSSYEELAMKMDLLGI